MWCKVGHVTPQFLGGPKPSNSTFELHLVEPSQSAAWCPFANRVGDAVRSNDSECFTLQCDGECFAIVGGHSLAAIVSCHSLLSSHYSSKTDDPSVGAQSARVKHVERHPERMNSGVPQASTLETGLFEEYLSRSSEPRRLPLDHQVPTRSRQTTRRDVRSGS